MITIDYNRGRGVQKNSKNYYIILEQPLISYYPPGHHLTIISHDY